MGNDKADLATRLVMISQPMSPIDLAIQAHFLHHLNAHTLCLLFKITKEQARDIVKNCSIVSPTLLFYT